MARERDHALWLDPSSYLPLRTSAVFAPDHGRPSLLVQDYRWLTPDRANLAALRGAVRQATIPAGFRTLPATDLPLAGLVVPGHHGTTVTR